MIEPCIGCDNIICICSPEEIQWALKNREECIIPTCRHCGNTFISKKWLDYHLVWKHKGDGY